MSNYRRLLIADQRALADVLREAIESGHRNGLTRDEILDRMPERRGRRGFPKRDYGAGGFRYPGIYRRYDPELERWVSRLGPLMTPNRLAVILRADARRKHPWFAEIRPDPESTERRITLADFEHGLPDGVDGSRRPEMPEPPTRVIRICKHGHAVTEENSRQRKNGYWECGPCARVRDRRRARARPKKRAYTRARRRRSARMRERAKREKKRTTGNPSIDATPFGRAVVIQYMRGPWWRHPSLVARRYPSAKRHPSRPGRCERGHDLRRTAIVADGLIACAPCLELDR